MYSRNVRYTIVDRSYEAYNEVGQVVSIAENAPPSITHGSTLVKKSRQRNYKTASRSKYRCSKKAKC